MRKALSKAAADGGLSHLEYNSGLFSLADRRAIKWTTPEFDMRTINAMKQRGWLQEEFKGWIEITPAGIEAAKTWGETIGSAGQEV